MVTDGAPGLIRAVDECFPRSYRQRCLAHRMRNLQAKVPQHLWPEVRARAKASYEAPSSAMAAALRDDFITTYERDLPSAVLCFKDDFEAATAHLRFPVTHRKVTRTMQSPRAPLRRGASTDEELSRTPSVSGRC